MLTIKLKPMYQIAKNYALDAVDPISVGDLMTDRQERVKVTKIVRFYPCHKDWSGEEVEGLGETTDDNYMKYILEVEKF
jgi:hypothetical protein